MLKILLPTLFCSKPENITDGGDKLYLTQETGEKIIGLTEKYVSFQRRKEFSGAFLRPWVENPKI